MIFSCHNLSAGYGSRAVLKNVSFSVRPHKLTVLLGKNGCGKSTLVSCINQQLPDYTGLITCCDRDIRLMTPQERARAVAILPQILPSPAVTVLELAAFGRSPYLGFGKRMTEQDRQIVQQAMTDAGVAGLADEPVCRLSGGERQKAFLAMILAQDTRLVVMDEPTTYMDIAYQAYFLDMLRLLKTKHKKTLLVVMHDLPAALEAADDVVVLHDGQVRFCGTADDCLGCGVLEDVFGVKQHIFQDNGRQYIVFDGKAPAVLHESDKI